jgi:hypothetical protein
VHDYHDSDPKRGFCGGGFDGHIARFARAGEV